LPYNAAATSTQVIESGTEFTIKPGYPECPILGCKIGTDTDCLTALSAPESTYITVDAASPFGILVS
jgi:hypothetical protein